MKSELPRYEGQPLAKGDLLLSIVSKTTLVVEEADDGTGRSDGVRCKVLGCGDLSGRIVEVPKSLLRRGQWRVEARES